MGTDYRSLYDKDYLGSWDVEAGEVTLTIIRVVGGTLTRPGGKQNKKPVCYFRETKKGFAVNPTNGKSIATMYGKAIEGWVGKRITLYMSMTRDPERKDSETECIRVRPNIPAASAPPPPAGWSPSPEPQQSAPASSQASRAQSKATDEKILRDQGSMFTLKGAFSDLWRNADGDEERQAWLKAEYDKCKAAIEKAEKEAAQ